MFANAGAKLRIIPVTAKFLIIIYTHPSRNGLSHALLEGETESAVTLAAAFMSQLLDGEGTIGSYSLIIKTDEMIDA